MTDNWLLLQDIAQLEDALDAANAKLARISVALVAPPSAEEALRLIREVLEDD